LGKVTDKNTKTTEKTKVVFHMAQCCVRRGNMAESSRKRQHKVTLNVGKG